MEKKTLLRYLFLTGCIILVSIFLPFGISYVSKSLSHRIRGQIETESEAPAEETEKKGSVGDPDKYVEDPYGNMLTNEEDIKAYEKYQDMVKSFSDYVSSFTTETMESSQVSRKEINSFLKYGADQFKEAAASYAYARWGTERTIRAVRFDSIRSYTDDEGNDVTQAMVEFLHTSNPETETGDMVICIYYKADGYFYFP